MATKLYLILSGAVFFFVAMADLVRLLVHWPSVVGPRTVPFALSYVALFASADLCIWALWRLFACEKRGGEGDNA